MYSIEFKLRMNITLTEQDDEAAQKHYILYDLCTRHILARVHFRFIRVRVIIHCLYNHTLDVYLDPTCNMY